MNCGLWAASLPPLKATFEGILTRYFGVSLRGTGSSRYGTSNQRYGNTYASRRSRAQSRLPDDDVFDGSFGGGGEVEAKTMGAKAYALDVVRKKNGSEDGISVESY
ncbi:hypothetical protein BFW01_g12834 [Lasiodiplodia theobromae]|nr:hypothetical protein BFW01_g12834 [Lasiodiplodia theobromae]